jgi:hypothetical protein
MGVRPGRGFAGRGASRGQAPKRRFTFLIFLTRIAPGSIAESVLEPSSAPPLRPRYALSPQRPPDSKFLACVSANRAH